MSEEKSINIKMETVDKVVDIISNSTQKTRNAIDTNTAKGIDKFLQLLNATPLGIKLDTYIAERPYKLEESMKKMKKNIKKFLKLTEQNHHLPLLLMLQKK